MKKLSTIIWGAILIAAGVILALNALGLSEVSVFFEGWWTLFIIVPCGVGLFTEKEKKGNLAGIAIGVLLLLCAQDVLSYQLLWKVVLAVAIVAMGIKLIVKGNFKNETERIQKERSTPLKPHIALFAGNDLSYRGDVFEGADLTAIFGGIECDLRGAEIEKDVVIHARGIFGGVTILVPPTVNVKVDSASIFGGVGNRTHQNSKENTVTLYVKGMGIFGGVDIK